MRVLLSLAVAISLISCSNQDVLNYCPSTKACIIVDNQVQLLEPESPEYTTLNIGACQTGRVECVGENAITCEDFVHPTEDICDGIDNNCNGVVDDGYDLDEDNFTTCNGDCDDGNNTVYPGAPELCDNLDNDCDGYISNDEADIDQDNYAVCDNDCNDNNYWINPGAEEFCDNLDNDCNELIDDNIPATNCGPEVEWGQCLYGENHCIDGELLCIGASYPQEEVCDNIDNNCNGWKDENIQRICYTACGPGVEICYAGDWWNCSAPEVEEEICDNVDNDCDGEVDEDCPCSQGESQFCKESPMFDLETGEQLTSPFPCGEGIQFCDINGEFGDCFFLRTVEEVCNAWDDDCDGNIDGMWETCGEFPGLAGIGICEPGKTYCEMGTYSECVNEVFPETEFCDGLDNDCDGLVDEELDPHDKVDMIFIVDISASMQPYIDALADAMTIYLSDFADTDHRFGLITTAAWGTNPQDFQIRSGVPGDMLVDFSTLTSLLTSLISNGMSLERTYDLAHMVCSPEDPLGISWRNDAHPYVVLMTDEPGQTGNNISQSEIASLSNNCLVGDCELGEPYEFFVITRPDLNQMWLQITQYELNRIKNILVNDVGSYVDMLKDMFTDICR